MHLAQLNIARLTKPLDHPDTADFIAGLVPINTLAESSPGFVWRMQGEGGDATDLRPHSDPDVIVNLTVWESAEALQDFVFRSAHTSFLRRRTEWFTSMEGPQVVAWWIPEGHRPTIDEAFERLERLAQHGPSHDAFTVTRPMAAGTTAATPARSDANADADAGAQPTRTVGAGPLDGLLVADFSRVLAGPYAAMTLGDLGADVIKVERPGSGDDTRTWGPPWVDGVATYYQGLNRNKRGITLDLSDVGDRRLALELAHRADVLIENFRPGTLDRYGLGYEQLRPDNPGLVYCSITGFGAATEAAAELSGYDLLVQAMSGLMSITGQPDGEPTKVGVAVVDHICALQATVGIMAALSVRKDTGRGQRVEVSLMSAALAALSNQASAYVGAGAVPRRMGNRHPSVVPYQPYEASDGWFVVACGNDAQFARVAAAIDQPQLAADERFARNSGRVVNYDELDRILRTAFASLPAQEWIERLNRGGVPAGPINDVAEAFAAADELGLDAVVSTPAGEMMQRTVRSPITLSETPASVRRPSPSLGQDDAEVKAWLESPR
jgi:crotonobetainyl-CoA:carnitine CoA-transferase CaiB-like acyl-CoA transferase